MSSHKRKAPPAAAIAATGNEADTIKSSPPTVDEVYELFSRLPEDMREPCIASLLTSSSLKIESVAITSLTFSRIVAIFGLTYSDEGLWFKQTHVAQIPHVGEIDELETDLIAYACSTSLLRFDFLYAKIFPRETEAVCRIAVDQALMEALAITSRAAQEWRSAAEIPHTTPDKIREALRQTRRHTPVDLQLRIICLAEVQVDSKVHRSEPKQKPKAKQRVGGVGQGGVVDKSVVYSGRADYAVALRDPVSQRLTSYLILVEAKRESEFSKARSQALGYVACIWEARKAKGARLDCTTYGLVTDGLRWQLIMIDHYGVVKEGELLDARFKGWAMIMSLLVAVVKRAAQLQTPKNSPAKSRTSEDETTSMDDDDVLHAPQTFYEQTTDETNEEEGEAGEMS